MPPALAIAIAIGVSVTVSIALETSGILSVMRRVKRVFKLTRSGVTSLYAGSSSTSSKVRPVSAILLEGSKLISLNLLEFARIKP